MPFRPVGETARWKLLYNVLASRDVGDTITYDELAEACNLHGTHDRRIIQLAMRRAAREYEVTDKRAIEAVTNLGYRIVQAEEHLRLAQGQQVKASRALDRGQSKVVNVDLNGMDPQVRHAFDVVANAFSLQADMLRRTTLRQNNLEQVMREVAERGERSAEELTELRARLERIEAEFHPTEETEGTSGMSAG